LHILVFIRKQISKCYPTAHTEPVFISYVSDYTTISYGTGNLNANRKIWLVTLILKPELFSAETAEADSPGLDYVALEAVAAIMQAFACSSPNNAFHL